MLLSNTWALSRWDSDVSMVDKYSQSWNERLAKITEYWSPHFAMITSKFPQEFGAVLWLFRKAVDMQQAGYVSTGEHIGIVTWRGQHPLWWFLQHWWIIFPVLFLREQHGRVQLNIGTVCLIKQVVPELTANAITSSTRKRKCNSERVYVFFNFGGSLGSIECRGDRANSLMCNCLCFVIAKNQNVQAFL